MFVSIGRRSKESKDLIGLLMECHDRIRSFGRLAEAAGSRADLPTSEVVDACLRCERYFAEALPLHIQDEEESLLPRLRGLRASVDEALIAMERQHLDHEPLRRALLAALERVRVSPDDEVERAALAGIAAPMVEAFEAHLAIEEAEIFPLLRELPAAAHAEIATEMRARRS